MIGKIISYNIESLLPKIDSGQHCLKLVQWFQNRRFLKKYTKDKGWRNDNEGCHVMTKSHMVFYKRLNECKNVKMSTNLQNLQNIELIFKISNKVENNGENS